MRKYAFGRGGRIGLAMAKKPLESGQKLLRNNVRISKTLESPDGLFRATQFAFLHHVEGRLVVDLPGVDLQKVKLFIAILALNISLCNTFLECCQI